MGLGDHGIDLALLDKILIPSIKHGWPMPYLMSMATETYENPSYESEKKSMITVSDNRPGKASKKGSEIEIRTAFSGIIGGTNSIFLRTYDGIVNLRDPKQTWSLSSYGPTVEAFEPVKLQITVSA